MKDVREDLLRLRYELVGLVVALAMLGYGLARGGGFHIMLIPLMLVLAAVYVSIERSRPRDDDAPSKVRSGPRRLLAELAIAGALIAYCEIAYSGDEAGDQIVVFSGILIAASLTALYLATRAPASQAQRPLSEPR